MNSMSLFFLLRYSSPLMLRLEMFLKLFVQSHFISIARIVDVVIENQKILFLTQSFSSITF